MERRPSTQELREIKRQFAGCTPYCPTCQRAAMERHMERDARWYAVVCIACDLKAAALED